MLGFQQQMPLPVLATDHVEEHLEYNLDNYLDFFKGRVGSEIFTAMYSAVDAVLDQPSCNLANILLQQFPDAKVSKDQAHASAGP